MGDVVAFAGDWPGESSVGQIRSLQPRAGAWLADVVPLEDQAGDVWRLPSAARARKKRTPVDVRDLVPLESEKASEDDSFVLTRLGKPAPGVRPLAGVADGLAARAEGYKPLPPDFRPKGGGPKVDYAAEARSREEYAGRADVSPAGPGFAEVPWSRVAATPRPRRGYSAVTSRGDAAAAA